MTKFPLLFSLACFSLTQSGKAALIITEVMSSSAHTAGTNNGDWFELTNTGTLDLNITGWSWDDNSATAGSSLFGSLTSIAAGQSVIITEETVGAESAWKTNWGLAPSAVVVNLGSGGFQGLGATVTGDQVNVYDAGNALVASVTFGLATTGVSFEWDKFGNSLGLSVIGENGAYQAPQNGQTANPGPGVDVGSPGVAVVPEPSVITALGAGLLMLSSKRRRRLS